MIRTNIIGLARGEINVLGKQKFRKDQVWSWLYEKGASSFDTMTDLSHSFRASLNEHYVINYGQEINTQKSRDRTKKWLLKYDDGSTIETVLIPENGRGTLCVSSQVGCSLACAFCHTGTQKMKRNLTYTEIVGQVMYAMKEQEEFPLSFDKPRSVNNIVFMGQGEPLYNFKNVKQAIEVLTARPGLGFLPKRITVSTSGIAPLIPNLAELNVTLAVSLHATNDRLRDTLVPINKTYPLEFLYHACREFLVHSKRDRNNPNIDESGISKGFRTRITFEYVLLDGVNDSIQEAERLSKWVLRLGARSLVNLIPFNPWPGSLFRCSSPEVIRKFSEILEQNGVESTVRTPRGRDIMAACGQLKSSEENKTSRQIIARPQSSE